MFLSKSKGDAKNSEPCEPVRAIFPQTVLILGQKGVLMLILGVLRKF